MTARGYTVVADADGRRHRRYVRWAEVDSAARLPEHLWRWRWRPEDRCAVAIPDSLVDQGERYHPCRTRPAHRTDLCEYHAGMERRPHDQAGRRPSFKRVAR